MYSAAAYIQHPNSYPSFLSYPTRNHHYLTDFTSFPSHKQTSSDNEDDNQSLSTSISDQTTEISYKKTFSYHSSRRKRCCLFRKNVLEIMNPQNVSRDTRRIKEQQIQERAHFLEQENSRLIMEKSSDSISTLSIAYTMQWNFQTINMKIFFFFFFK